MASAAWAAPTPFGPRSFNRDLSRRMTDRPKKWLLLHFVLVWSKSGCSGDPGRWVATGGHGFEGSSPTQVGRKIFGGDAVEGSHPLFEASVVGVDGVDMELWFFGLGIAGRRQDVDFELGPLGESGDGRSA